ncbi:MAG: hypothetical protein R3Y67_09865 [Eubacteriales bacterium]
MNTPKGFVDDSIMALLNDEAVIKKWVECKSLEECYDVVKDKTTVSFDEFKPMMAIIVELSKKTNDGLLSEDDLDAVAGGSSWSTIMLELGKKLITGADVSLL